MEIVFVHFGSNFPKHLILNLKRTCELFADFNVVLITDASKKIKIDKDNFRKSYFRMNNDYKILNECLNHPKEFRNNFWFTSLARIFALCDYVASNNVSILHIESDVLVARDLPLDRFAMCDRPIAYGVVGNRSGVASVMWIKDAQAAINFRQYAEDSVQKDPMTTDMKILGRYQEDFPQRVRVLASFPTKNTSSCKSLSPQIMDDFTYTENLFEGLFDAADIGQYLFGDDPRNHRGFKLLRRQLATSYFSPREVRYIYSEKRNFLETTCGFQNRLYSLHIHSKDPKMFKESKIQGVTSRAIRNQDKPEEKILVLPVLIKSIKNSILRRMNFLIVDRK
jgi:hypothetical protein